MTNLIEDVKAARRVGTPILAIATADQYATIATLSTSLNGSPQLRWDAIGGIKPINDAGLKSLASMGKPAEIAANTGNVNACVDFASKLEPNTVLYMVNAHRFMAESVCSTGISNVRDDYKGDGRTLILLGPSFTLPSELQGSVVVLDEALPSDAQLGTILADVWPEKTPAPKADITARAVTATRGLCAFMAEQTFAMSLSPTGLDIDKVWERKIATVNQTPGLTLSIGGPTFKDIRGLSQIAKLMALTFSPSNANQPEAILRIDEIEKQLAGATGGDTSGTSQDALGQVLQWMEDGGHTGFIAVGPGGSGKSLISKAIGATYNKPTLEADLGAAKGKFVGDSEGMIRQLLKTVTGIAGGKPVLVIATSNDITALPSALRRRFKLGTWFFDLPNVSEREAIWQLYLGKYNLDPKADRPADDSWTGAEIRNACETASNLGITPREAGEFIVPVATADPDGLQALRTGAEGRYLSASAPGRYTMAARTERAKGRGL